MPALKVLHLPVNIASQISVTVKALRDIGVQARGLVVTPAVMQSRADVEILPEIRRGDLRSRLRRWQMLAAAICWADVVHWHFGSSLMRGALDVRLASLLRKTRLVEFWGSDIRIPEIAAQDNPYLARLGNRHEYGSYESLERSRRTQERFARAGFACLIPSEELMPYVQRDLFTKVYASRQRVIIEDYIPRYPDPHKRRPRIVHSPSAKAYKGTPVILDVMDRLAKSLDFEFVLVHNMPKDQAQQIVATADIFLDQFVGGDYGLAAIEAMTMGKPVVCYIKPSIEKVRPSPIVNANQDNLGRVLQDLITDASLRNELGQRSRAFAETHHDAHKIARALVTIYKQLQDG